MKYNEAEEYLNSFINYERRIFFPYKKSLKLGRVKYLLDTLGVPYQNLKAIHIAGTKGKGSTATFCSYILASSGFKVGLFTSPHFFDFRERIKIVRSQKSEVRSQKISKKDVVRIIEEFRPHLERMRFTKEWGKLTFFEVYTALAFRYFLENSLDFVVLETGLGGRLDATNVVYPLITIITHIGYDHTHKLGRRLRDIAYEKAGIIKPNVAVVSSFQRRVAWDQIKRKAQTTHSKLFLLGRDFKFHKVRLNNKSSTFDFSFNNCNLDNLRIRMKGIHQIENASLAVAGLCILKDRGLIEKNLEFRKGLKESFIEGRFEVARKMPLIILDIAHNASSFLALSKTIDTYFPGRRIILIFAASKDKDIKNMVNKINFDNIIITSFGNPRSFSPEDIKRVVKSEQALIAKDPREALRLGLKLYKKNSLIVVAGSLYLVAEIKKLL
jgi:dihydrofolate synthase/folylpolyglutamate synthase